MRAQEVLHGMVQICGRVVADGEGMGNGINGGFSAGERVPRNGRDGREGVGAVR